MMLRLPRERRKSSGGLFLLSILLFITFDPAIAAQEVIYKDIRPLKNVFDTEQTATESEIEQDFIYNPTGKTDPFKSFIAIREETAKKERRKPKTYLETLELSQLDLTVIVISPNGKWAMVRDSKGIGHVIKEGIAIGRNGGIVYKIKQGEVIIREEYKDFRGRTQHKETSKTTPSLR
ncbi:MAG: pilus assembly protein PilP [Deltaproteobacteria bacterium]|nr:pilus assembly protein PilP [Deltaproteobacteria bacterium]